MAYLLAEEELFCLEGCRSYSQYHHMRLRFEEGRCQFCDIDRALNILIWEDAHAMAWHVPEQFMRKELRNHLLIIPKRHVRFPWELSVNENIAMLEAREFIAAEYQLDGGILVTRFGDMRLNAGTVPHLHENIMVPNGTGEVRVPAFKDPKDRAENQARAAGFAMRYEAGEQP